jgi:plasmid replication initiation protein
MSDLTLKLSEINFGVYLMKHHIVRKSNSLIEATYKLSTVEQKVILFLASTLKPDDDDFKPYRFHIREFQKFLKKADANYSWLEQNILSLKNKNLHIVYENAERKKVILNVNWLSSSKYVEGSGYIELRFDPNLKPFLLHLKERFTNYRLANIVQLKSRFSIRLYELLKQYEKIGKRTFGLYDLRTTLGIEDDQYKQYTDFRKRVIQVAENELKEKTDISFTFKEHRASKKVDSITFTIYSNAPDSAFAFEKLEMTPVETQEQEIDSDLESLKDIIPPIYRNKISIKKLLHKHIKGNGFEYVMRNIIYTNEKSNAVKSESKSSRSNYRAYLAKALQNDYGLAYMEDKQAEKEAVELKQKTFAEAEKQKQRELKKIDQERENREKAREFMETCSSETVKDFEQQAIQRLLPESLKRYQRKDVIGVFEYKRKLEDVVMEHIGIKTKYSPDSEKTHSN